MLQYAVFGRCQRRQTYAFITALLLIVIYNNNAKLKYAQNNKCSVPLILIERLGRQGRSAWLSAIYEIDTHINPNGRQPLMLCSGSPRLGRLVLTLSYTLSKEVPSTGSPAPPPISPCENASSAMFAVPSSAKSRARLRILLRLMQRMPRGCCHLFLQAKR